MISIVSLIALSLALLVVGPTWAKNRKIASPQLKSRVSNNPPWYKNYKAFHLGHGRNHILLVNKKKYEVFNRKVGIITGVSATPLPPSLKKPMYLQD